MDKATVTICKDVFEYLCRDIEREMNKVADNTLDEWAPVVHSTTRNYTELLMKVLFEEVKEGD